MVNSAPGRSAVAWVMAAWASFVLLPWYKVEGGFLSFDWLARPEDATPAILLALGSRLWLLPLILILLVFGALIVLTAGSAIAPFIYTLF